MQPLEGADSRAASNSGTEEDLSWPLMRRVQVLPVCRMSRSTRAPASNWGKIGFTTFHNWESACYTPSTEIDASGLFSSSSGPPVLHRCSSEILLCPYPIGVSLK